MMRVDIAGTGTMAPTGAEPGPASTEKGPTPDEAALQSRKRRPTRSTRPAPNSNNGSSTNQSPREDREATEQTTDTLDATNNRSNNMLAVNAEQGYRIEIDRGQQQVKPPDQYSCQDNDNDDDSSAELSTYLESKLAALLIDDDDREEKKDTEDDLMQHTLDELLADENPPTTTTTTTTTTMPLHMTLPIPSSPVRSASIQFPVQHNESFTNKNNNHRQLPQREQKDGAPDRPIIVDAPPAQTPRSPRPARMGTRRHTDPGLVPNHPNDQLTQSDHSPRRRTSLDRVHNPMTGYSPGKYRRKRIWGSSHVQLPHLPQLQQLPRRQTSTNIHASHHDVDLSDSASTSSISSEEMLERKAAQIRAELRYAELVQLAEDAERAAEAGQESYSGRPWIAGTDFDNGGEKSHLYNNHHAGNSNHASEVSPSSTAPSAIKRHFSFSEGLPMPTSPLRQGTSRQPTLPAGVQNLRDAEDVFPSFDLFHKNLRTHYLRHRVSQKILIFREEESENVPLPDDGKDHKKGHQKTTSSVQDLERRLTKGAQDFMNSFSFDILRQSASSQSQQHVQQQQPGAELVDWVDGTHLAASNDGHAEDEDDASSVGDVLAEHIHSSEHPSAHKSIHPISLPGLPLPDTALSILPSPSKHHEDEGNVSNAADRSITSPSLGRSPSVDDEGMTQPRVLFPAGAGGGGKVYDGAPLSTKRVNSFAMAPETPVQDGSSELHDFVTPARLREIRRPEDERIRSLVDRESMILPANSVIQESPCGQVTSPLHTPSSEYRQQMYLETYPHHPGGSRAPPVKDLLLPAFSADAADNPNAGDPVVRPAPSRSYDDDDDVANAGEEFQLLDPIQEQLSASDSRTGSKASSLVSPGASPRSGSFTRSPAVGTATATATTTTSSLVLSLHEEDRPPRHGNVGANPSSISTESPKRRIIRPSLMRNQEMTVRNVKVPLLTETPQGSFDEVDCRCLMSPSLEQLQDMMDDDDDDMDHGMDGINVVDSQAHCRIGEGGPSSLRQSAMNMLHKLSPGRKNTAVKTRALFVHPKVNDDFLQNYMYCSRDGRSDVPSLPQNPDEGFCMTGEPCQDDAYCGLGLAFFGLNYCGFDSLDVDCMTAGGGITNMGGGGNSAQPSTEILPLTLTPYKRRHAQHDGTHPTSEGGGSGVGGGGGGWFDAATERVDDMIDNYIFGTKPQVGHFQPPSLRKIMRNGTGTHSKDGTDVNHFIDVNNSANGGGGTSTGGTSTTGHPPGLVQALFPPAESDLSDTQYALVFGTSRSDDDARTVPLEPPPNGFDRFDVSEGGIPAKEAQAAVVTRSSPSSPLCREILPSYSSSSDEPVQEQPQRTKLQEEEPLSMTYISEPSLIEEEA